MLDLHRLSTDQVRLEVTEGALLDNPDQVLATLDTLRDAGVLAALDDFGTGYSSLSYLHRFPLHALKIDRSFISALQLRGTGGSAAVVRAVLALAGTLGLEVVAEGIETAAQQDHLLQMGCEQGQGFLFSRARPASEWASHGAALTSAAATDHAVAARYWPVVGACMAFNPKHGRSHALAPDHEFMQRPATCDRSGQHQRWFQPGVQAQRQQPVRTQHDQALVQHVPRIQRFIRPWQPAQRTVEQQMCPAQDGAQRGPDVEVAQRPHQGLHRAGISSGKIRAKTM
jgi:hypothetical protein